MQSDLFIGFPSCDDCGSPWPEGRQRQRHSDGRYRCAPCARERARGQVLEWHADHPEALARHRALRKERYATDPEYRETVKAQSRARRAKPESKAKRRAYHRAKYATDPAYREQRKAEAKRHFERYANDPVRWERLRERCREKDRARRADPVKLAAENARRRDRLANDPVWRAKELARKRGRRKRKVRPLFERQGGVCNLCRQPLDLGERVDVDHILPRVDGGSDSIENLQLLCVGCHMEKTRAEAMDRAARRRAA